MKKLLALTLALLLTLSIAACHQEETPENTDLSSTNVAFVSGAVGTDMDGIYVRMAGIYTTDGKTTLVVSWFNETSASVTGGDVYDIQRLENGEWVSCGVQTTTVKAVTLGPDNITNKSYDITDSYDLSIPGAYRYTTTCKVSQSNGSQKECSMWAQFEIN